MSDLYIESRLQAIKDIAIASCADIKDADNIASFCDEIYSAIPNIDKVVEELQEFLINYVVSEKSNVHQRIIEIVKQGGTSDDVCEWKSASDGELIQNPHTKRLYSNEPSMQNVYCNTCGKKIKIVGDCCRYRDNRTYLDIIYELIKADMLESDCAKEMESD